MAKNDKQTYTLEEILEKAKTGELEGRELPKISLKKADLSGARLAGADLSKVSFKKADLSGANLACAKLIKTDLVDADLSGADLTGADLTSAFAKGANFNNANLTGATLSEATLTAATFKNTVLADAVITEAVINKAVFEKADCKKVDFSESDLTDAELIESDFQDVKFKNTGLQNCRIEKCDFKNIDAPGADFSLSSIIESDFCCSMLESADFANTLLEHVKFAECVLKKSLFNVSEHKNVDLSKADIEGAAFKSLTGYSEQEIGGFKERGAKVDLFLIRRFFRKLRSSIAAQIATVTVIGLLAAGVYFYVSNPNNWSYEKLDQVAQERMSRGDYSGAKKLYDIVLDKYALNHQKVSTAKNQIGALYLSMKRYDKAEETYKEVLKKYPDLESAVVTATLGMGDVEKGRKNLDGAITIYQEVSSKWPDFPQAIMAQDRIAKIAMSQGNIEKAQEIYEKIKQTYADNAGAVAQAEFDIADLYRSQGKDAEALKKYREIYEKYADDPFNGTRALSSILQVHVSRGELDKAEELLEKIKKEYPEDLNSRLDAELFIANALSSRGKYEEAGKMFRSIIEDHDEQIQAMWAGSSLADMLISARQYDQASKLLDELINQWGNKEKYRVQFELSRARLLSEQNKSQEAIDLLKELIVKLTGQRRKVDVQLVLADLYLQQRNFDAAEAVYREVLAGNSDSPITVNAAKMGIARLYERRGENDKAMELLKDVAERSDDMNVVFDAQFSEVRILRARNDEDGVQKVLEQMLETHKAYPERQALIHMTLAESYRIQKKYDEALAILRPIMDSEKKESAVNAYAAAMRVYGDMGNAEKASELVAELEKKFPDEDAARYSAALEAADLLLVRGNTDEAIAKYKEVADAAKGTYRHEALSSILNVYVVTQDLPKARQIYKTITDELPPGDEFRANAELGFGNLLRIFGRYDEAITLYQGVIDQFKNKDQSAWAMAALGQTYIEQQQFDDAIKIYQQLAEQFGKTAEHKVKAYLGLGSAEEIRRRIPEALAYYEQAEKAADTEADKLNARGAVIRLKAELGDVQQAEQMVAQMRKEYPEQIGILESIEFSLANAYQKTQDFPRALEKLEMVRKKTENQVNWGNATLTIANIYAQTREYDKAVEAYREVEKKLGDNPNFLQSARSGIAQIYLNRKEFDKAIAQYRNLLGTAADTTAKAQIRAQLARIYMDRGETAKAREQYGAIEEEGGSDPTALYEMNMGIGEILRKEGNVDQAIERFNKAYEAAGFEAQKLNALNSIAQVYSEQGQYDKALKIYERMGGAPQGGGGLMIDTKFGQALVLEQNHQYDEALTVYNEIIKSTPDDLTKARAEMAVANIYTMQKKGDKAEATLEGILQKYAKHPTVVLNARNGLASLYSSMQDFDKALAAYKQIEETAGDKNQIANARIAQARILATKGQLEDADKIFRSLINDAGTDPNLRFEARSGQADLYREQGKYDQALAAYQMLFKNAKDENTKIAALNSIASTYSQSARYDEAMKAYRRMTEEFAGNRSTLLDGKLGIANTYKELREGDKALTQYQDIIDNYGDTMQAYWAYMGKAQILSESGRIEEAKAVYETVAKQFPESKPQAADAKLNMANMLKNANRRQEAMADFNEIIENYPGQVHAVWALQGKAQIFTESGDYESADVILDRVISDYSQFPDAVSDARLSKADLLAMSGRNDDAIKAFRELIPDLDRGRKLRAKSAMANAYAAKGDDDGAEKVYNEIIKENQDNPQALVEAKIGLGELALKRGRSTEAIPYFKEVIDTSNTPSRVSWAMQSLARAYIDQDEMGKVEQLVNDVEKRYPDDINAVINIRMNAANRFREQQKPDQAIAQLDPVIEKFGDQPHAAWALHTKAQILMEQQKFAEATAIYNHIIDKYSANQTAIIDAHLGLGQIALYSGNQEKAKKIFLEIAEKYPDYQQSIAAKFALAQLYEQSNDLVKLEQVYADIVKTHKSNKTAYINACLALGNVHNRLRDFDQAITYYENIYDKYPTEESAGWALSGAARAMINLGKEGEAEVLLKRILDQFPNNKDLTDGAKRTLEELYKR